jgi:orotidine-5'-phosphate decarboxylase
VIDQSARRRLAFPLDYDSLDAARRAAHEVAESVGVLKVGLELFVKEGPAAVRLGRELDRDVFLDLKLHDIPATVDGAVGAAAALGARYLTVHAFGGPEMIERAVRRAERESPDLTIIATPGIRPAGATSNDQKRTGTPREAIRAGATILVVGRPIRDAANPAAAARSVLDEISEAIH